MNLRTALPALSLAAVAAGAPAQPPPGVFLPGTQPRENRLVFESAEQCRACHGHTRNADADPYFSWSGGMMAQAMRDPLFRAALAIANQDIPGIGEFCLRCHAPGGWLEGRSTPPDASALNARDLQGVSCALCHRLVDPRSPEAARLAKHLPPGLGNAMMVVDPSDVMRGPYGDDRLAQFRGHRARRSDFHATGHLCGVCHNVSNPAQAADVGSQPPHAFGHVERTYSEWVLSEFARRGAEGSCQACHYPTVSGGGYATRFGQLRREHFVVHGPVGGSTWVQEAIWLLWKDAGLDRKALYDARQRARRLLRTAAKLELSFPQPGRVRLRITNLTGHKLPTGYPEGRRMWVNARFFDRDGKLLEEIGRYGEKADALSGSPVKVPTLLDPDRTRVYECLPAISPARAAKHDKPAGPSFHFVLNDVIALDNRIPPKGFDNRSFATHHCAPVGARYADGQHWDDVEFALPPKTARVAVRLLYQSASWEYIRFLAEENRTDEWGRRLYEAWSKTGRCPPEPIAEITADVPAANDG